VRNTTDYSTRFSDFVTPLRCFLFALLFLFLDPILLRLFFGVCVCIGTLESESFFFDSGKGSTPLCRLCFDPSKNRLVSFLSRHSWIIFASSCVYAKWAPSFFETPFLFSNSPHVAFPPWPWTFICTCLFLEFVPNCAILWGVYRPMSPSISPLPPSLALGGVETSLEAHFCCPPFWSTVKSLYPISLGKNDLMNILLAPSSFPRTPSFFNISTSLSGCVPFFDPRNRCPGFGNPMFSRVFYFLALLWFAIFSLHFFLLASSQSSLVSSSPFRYSFFARSIPPIVLLNFWTKLPRKVAHGHSTLPFIIGSPGQLSLSSFYP